MSDWTEVSVLLRAADLERAEPIVTLVFGGMMLIEDYSDLEQNLPSSPELVDQALLDKDRTKATIKMYLSQQENPEELGGILAEKLRAQGIENQIQFGTVNESDWADNWKQYFHPFHVGRLVVCPSWELYSGKPEEVVLTIDPGMAFGTGQHETTRMCLELIEKNIQPGDRVLDMGCGSGILAVAALLLGADQAVGVDIDEYALKTARENAERNGVGQRFSAYAGDVSASHELGVRIGEGYDMIAANIVADVLMAQAAFYNRKLKPGGKLVASGIIDTRGGEVENAFKAAGFTLLGRRERKNWVALEFTK